MDLPSVNTGQPHTLDPPSRWRWPAPVDTPRARGSGQVPQEEQKHERAGAFDAACARSSPPQKHALRRSGYGTSTLMRALTWHAAQVRKRNSGTCEKLRKRIRGRRFGA